MVIASRRLNELLHFVGEQQIRLSKLIETETLFPLPLPPIILALASYPVDETENLITAGLLYHGEKVIDTFFVETLPLFPYIPNYLFLRNLLPMIKVVDHFNGSYDVIMVEGSGILHPRGCGLACNIGLLSKHPTIGITKNWLFGDVDYDRTLVTSNDYEIFPVRYDEIIKGFFIKKTKNKNGVYISIGNKISLIDCLHITIKHMNFSVPEPLRLLKSVIKRKIND